MDASSNVGSRPGSGIARFVKEPFSGLSHALGCLLAVGATAVLLTRAQGSAWHMVGYAVYGVTMTLLFLASALVHSLHCSPRLESRLERFDFACIFLLIAGTYTPICLTVLRGPWGWSLLGVQWTLAILGIFSAVFHGNKYYGWRTLVYVAMGWMVLVAIAPLWRSMSGPALLWLIVGGAAYSVGALVFFLEKPRLWPGRFGAHDLWHVLVLLGAGSHFVMMLQIM